MLVRTTVLSCALWCGCAATPAAAPAPERAGVATPVTLRLPAILPAVPSRPFIDLGPVLASEDRHATSLEGLLLAQADVLRADGFVFEARAIAEVYGVDWSRDADWRDNHPALSFAADVVGWLLSGEIGLLGEINAPMRKARSGYYRAFRYVDGDPPALPAESLPLSAELRPWLEKATTLRGQLAAAHGLLALGAVDREHYESLRRALIAD